MSSTTASAATAATLLELIRRQDFPLPGLAHVLEKVPDPPGVAHWLQTANVDDPHFHALLLALNQGCEAITIERDTSANQAAKASKKVEKVRAECKAMLDTAKQAKEQAQEEAAARIQQAQNEALARIAAAQDATQRAQQLLGEERAPQTTNAAHRSLASDPPVFTADEKDANKRYTEYSAWRSKLAIRFVQDGPLFTTEMKKVLHVLSLLAGSAYLAVETYLHAILANPNDPDQWQWETVEDLFTDLDSRYHTLDVAADAENRLITLKQSGDFVKFHDFITEFTILADRCGRDQASRVREIRDKMSAKLRAAVAVQASLPGAADFAGWTKLLRSLATNIEGEDFRNKVKADQKAQNGHRKPDGGQKHAAAHGDPMDLSQVRVNRISDEEMSYRLQNNLCKRCGEAGHYAVNCTTSGRGRGGAQPGRGAPGRLHTPAPQWAQGAPQQQQWAPQPQQWPPAGRGQGGRGRGAARGGPALRAMYQPQTQHFAPETWAPPTWARPPAEQRPQGYVEGEVESSAGGDQCDYDPHSHGQGNASLPR
jgi:hypothetical protein